MNRTINLFSFLAWLVLWLCIASTNSIAHGVQNLKFKHYSIEQGLSQVSANDIIQDREGYIWIATQEGLTHIAAFWS